MPRLGGLGISTRMEPQPLQPGASTRSSRWILAAAGALLVAIYGLESRGSISRLFAPVAADRETGPFAKGSDAMGYYAWLRSPLLDGDFQFDDEFAATFASVPGSEASLPITATGHRPNPWPVGPAIAWAPAVTAVHLILRALGVHSPWQADGYSPPYQLAVGGTTLLLALATLVLAYRISRRFASPTPSAAGAALIVLGSPIVAYGAVEVSLSHGPATAALALFAYAWLKTLGSTRLARWIGIGLLLGIACLMRWQLATYALLPFFEAVWLAFGAANGRAGVRCVFLLVSAGTASIAAFAPQFAVKAIIYGSPLGGLHKTAQNWLDPALGSVLFSTNNGLFYWTPLVLAAFVGLLAIACRSRVKANPAAAIVFAAAAIQIYTVSALQGREAYLGWSFGLRHLTETCVLFAPGLAFLFDRATPRAARRLARGAGLLVGWNLLLLGVYRHCVGGMQGGSPGELLEWVARYIALRPLEGVGIALATLGFTRVLVGAFRQEATTAIVEAMPLRNAA